MKFYRIERIMRTRVWSNIWQHYPLGSAEDEENLKIWLDDTTQKCVKEDVLRMLL